MIVWERWQNDENLRQSVRDRLKRWGGWSQGGEDNLGFPSHAEWTIPPEHERMATAYPLTPREFDEATESERVISTMAATTRKRSAWLLWAFYKMQQPIWKITKAYNEEFKQNIRTEEAAARLTDAEWIFACLC